MQLRVKTQKFPRFRVVLFSISVLLRRFEIRVHRFTNKYITK